MKNYHIFKYYLNAAHSVDNNAEHAHTHTFTISFLIDQPDKGESLPFTAVDSLIESYLQKFRGKYLNGEKDFLGINPTLENIGEVIYDQMGRIMREHKLTLLQVEICENPLRVYSISNCILLPSASAGKLSSHWEKMLKEKTST